MNVERRLARLRAPDERAAQARAWSVVRSAYQEQSPVAASRRRWRLTMAPALVAIVAALTLTPAGAKVGRLITHALGVPHARALLALPAPGQVLVSGSGGTWIVSADGARRRLGRWRQASWSPHGRYVAVTGADGLAVVTPRGDPRWALARTDVSDPRWYPPTGFRIAYRSGGVLRVVAGDGTGDHLLAASVAPVAAAWRPDHPYQLAYVQGDRVIVRDADTAQPIWSRRAVAVRRLDWSADGTRLLALGRGGVQVLAATGRSVATVPIARGTTMSDAALSPDGRQVAIVRDGAGPGVLVASLGSRRPRLRSLLPGPGVRLVAWSPNGRWLLASWPVADQWVFVTVHGSPQIAAVSHIARQFAGRRSDHAFPRVEGWCCTALGSAG